MIVLASAKTMNESTMENTTIPKFQNKANIIRESIKDLDKQELSAYFKIKGKTLETTFNYYHSEIKGRTISSLAGAVFKEIKADDNDYIGANVFVLDAMYGVLNGNDCIDLYRLDFNTKSLIDLSYYQYWKADVNEFINNHSSNQLLILSSDEYTKLLELNTIEKEIFTIQFDNEITSSVHKKQIRGKITNYCIKNKIFDYKLLDNITIDQYICSLSCDNVILVSKGE